MERTIQMLIAGLMLAFASVADAAYLIKLKNGNEFLTGRYWQEGTQVMFDTYGGVFGIDRSFVIKIEESNKPLTLISTLENSVEVGSIKGKQESKKASSAGDQKFEAKRDENSILRDFDALKAKVKGLNGMLTPELQEFSRNLTELKRRIQLSGKSNDYLREFIGISEMGEMVEAALKSRPN